MNLTRLSINVFLVLGLLVFSFYQKGEIEFSKTFGTSGPDRGVAVINTKDGNFLIVGNASNPGKGLDVYAVKVDKKGNQIWEGFYGGPKNDNGWSVIEVKDGYIITGFTEKYSPDNNDILLLKIDDSGNELWLKSYGGQGDDIAWSLKRAPNGNLLIGAQTNSFGAGDYDAMLFCTTIDADSLWSKTYGGENVDRVFSLDVTKKGEVVLAGITYSYGAGDRDAWLVKTDPEGNLLWHRTYGGKGYDNAHHVLVNEKGNIVLTGYGEHFNVNGEWDIFLKEIDLKGMELWSKSYGTNGGDRGIDVIQTIDHGYFITGFINQSMDSGPKAIVVKTNNSGEEIWQNTFGSGYENIAYSSTQDGEGNYIITGHTTSQSNNNSDLWIVKFN